MSDCCLADDGGGRWCTAGADGCLADDGVESDGRDLCRGRDVWCCSCCIGTVVCAACLLDSLIRALRIVMFINAASCLCDWLVEESHCAKRTSSLFRVHAFRQLQPVVDWYGTVVQPFCRTDVETTGNDAWSCGPLAGAAPHEEEHLA